MVAMNAKCRRGISQPSTHENMIKAPAYIAPPKTTTLATITKTHLSVGLSLGSAMRCSGAPRFAYSSGGGFFSSITHHLTARQHECRMKR